MRAPFETDEKSNIIDYNWQVDGILKNSQSYNKETGLLLTSKKGGGKGALKKRGRKSHGGHEQIMAGGNGQGARRLTHEDLIMVPQKRVPKNASIIEGISPLSKLNKER